MTRTRTIDLWSQLNGGRQFNEAERDVAFPAIGGLHSPPEVLVLGQSRCDDVLKFCGLRAQQLKWHQRGAEDFPGAENWPYAQSGDFHLFFDAEMRWQGLNWGPGANEPSLVTWAVLKEDEAREEEGVVAGRLRLLLNGGGIRHHAVLPDFIASLSGCGLHYTLKAMNDGKWLKLHTRNNSATLSAEFSLRALKASHESRFEIDYCLISLSLFAPGLAQWTE